MRTSRHQAVGPLVLAPLDERARRPEQLDVVSRGPQQPFDGAADRIVVVHDHHARLVGHVGT